MVHIGKSIFALVGLVRYIFQPPRLSRLPLLTTTLKTVSAISLTEGEDIFWASCLSLTICLQDDVNDFARLATLFLSIIASRKRCVLPMILV